MHTHSEDWQHFQSILLSLAVEQIEHPPRRLPPSFFTVVVCFQVISIALLAHRICLSTFLLSALILICSLKAFLLPGKADIDVFDYSSFVAYWDTSASTVQMHLRKQQQSNSRIVSKTWALLSSYRLVPSQVGPEYKVYYKWNYSA